MPPTSATGLGTKPLHQAVRQTGELASGLVQDTLRIFVAGPAASATARASAPILPRSPP